MRGLAWAVSWEHLPGMDEPGEGRRGVKGNSHLGSSPRQEYVQATALPRGGRGLDRLATSWASHKSWNTLARYSEACGRPAKAPEWIAWIPAPSTMSFLLCDSRYAIEALLTSFFFFVCNMWVVLYILSTNIHAFHCPNMLLLIWPASWIRV